MGVVCTGLDLPRSSKDMKVSHTMCQSNMPLYSSQGIRQSGGRADICLGRVECNEILTTLDQK